MNSCIKIFLFVGCFGLCRGRSVRVNGRSCTGTVIDIDTESDAIYLHYVSMNVARDACVYEFRKTDNSNEICVKVLEFQVKSSRLRLEYHNVMYSRRTNERFDRDSSPDDEYCTDDSNFFVAFVSPNTDGYDYVHLKVYQKEESFGSKYALVIGLVVGGAVAVAINVFVVWIVCRRRAQLNRANTQHQFAYHTASPNSVTIQPGGCAPQSNVTQYQPVPTHQQDGYNVYPTQVAYPIGQEPAYGTQPQSGQIQHNTNDKDLSAAPPQYPGY